MAFLMTESPSFQIVEFLILGDSLRGRDPPSDSVHVIAHFHGPFNDISSTENLRADIPIHPIQLMIFPFYGGIFYGGTLLPEKMKEMLLVRGNESDKGSQITGK